MTTIGLQIIIHSHLGSNVICRSASLQSPTAISNAHNGYDKIYFTLTLSYLHHSYLSLSRYISFFVYLKSFILIILSFSLYWEGLVLPGSLLWCKYIAGQWSLISFGPIHLLPSELYLVIYPVLSLTVLEASGLCVVFLRNVPKIYKRIHLIILKSCPCFTTVMDQTVAT